ncbi:hypothetical protein M427DRAFT_475762 [Gonapodya prolifera JEL478]|uniref:BHLH domain-containing protein n=1 Tax=Gonapodya prolifera (strain JEL478) TaxID=1344416 RepID=A0A139A1B7_GONPJ|nr:hypothetical protein M427DRAFT_475762 [Gonapodya prolifera JEL478]|eukprot:KXS10576.1 hypothetical protein M427DRAFT_475762 [Gonapodya prolifera JEL478]
MYSSGSRRLSSPAVSPGSRSRPLSISPQPIHFIDTFTDPYQFSNVLNTSASSGSFAAAAVGVHPPSQPPFYDLAPWLPNLPTDHGGDPLIKSEDDDIFKFHLEDAVTPDDMNPSPGASPQHGYSELEPDEFTTTATGSAPQYQSAGGSPCLVGQQVYTNGNGHFSGTVSPISLSPRLQATVSPITIQPRGMQTGTYSASMPAGVEYAYYSGTPHARSLGTLSIDTDDGRSAGTPDIVEKKRTRREKHIAVERRRRDIINEKLNDLTELLPSHMLSGEGATVGVTILPRPPEQRLHPHKNSGLRASSPERPRHSHQPRTRSGRRGSSVTSNGGRTTRRRNSGASARTSGGECASTEHDHEHEHGSPSVRPLAATSLQ